MNIHRFGVSIGVCALLLTSAAHAQNIISTVAGGGTFSGAATSADLTGPWGVAVSNQCSSGCTFYIAGFSAQRILKVDSTGQISVFAGTGIGGYSGDGGPAINAQFSFPFGVALDSSGNLFVADTANSVIRKIDTAGIITTVAGNGFFGFSGDGGPATSATLNSPEGIAVDSSDNLFFSDTNNCVVRRVDAATQIITTVAGTQPNPANPPSSNCAFGGDTGLAVNALLNFPAGVAVEAATGGGDIIFIADLGNRRVRRVDASGTITTYAGNGNGGWGANGGPAASTNIGNIQGVALDTSGNLYINSTGTGFFGFVSASTQNLFTVAGTGTQGFSGDGGSALSAELNHPTTAAIDAANNIYIADRFNVRIRQVTGFNPSNPSSTSPIINTVAGGGSGGDGGSATGSSVILGQNIGVALDSSDNVFIADFNNGRIREVSGGNISTFAGTGIWSFGGDGGPATSAQLNRPTGLSFDSSGNLYFAEFGNHIIRKVSGGTISTVAGTPGVCGFFGDGGPATSAQLCGPFGAVKDNSGNLFIADTSNFVIRRVDTAGNISTYAGIPGVCAYFGDNGPATAAGLCNPQGLTVDASGNLFISDSSNNVIRRVDAATQTITTYAGNGICGFFGDTGPATAAGLCFPEQIGFDPLGNLFIADNGNNRVRQVFTPTGVITTVAGDGIFNFFGDGGPDLNAGFSSIFGVAVGPGETLAIGEFPSNRVRQAKLTLELSSLALNFGAMAPGFTSQPQTLVMTNLSGSTVSSISITKGGVNAADFAETTACAASLTNNTSCTITVTFSPTSLTAESATLTITSSDVTSPQTIQLSGTGASIPVAVASPARLDFPMTPVFNSSAPLTVTVTNVGTSGLQITGISLSDFFDFSETDNCTISTVKPNSSCTINVIFNPFNNITFSATLQIFDNAAGSPQTVQLNGTGGPGPAVELFPTSMNFGTQALGTTSGSQVTQIFNVGSANLVINSIQIGPDFVQTNNCSLGTPMSVDVGCTITISFVPLSAGVLGETLTISDNAPNSPQVVQLTGTGVAPAPVVTLSTTGLGFGSLTVGQPALSLTVTVINNGTATLNPPALAISPNTAPFTASGCTAAVTPGNSCVVTVTFAPTAAGTFTATLTLTDNAANSPQVVQLSGSGVSPLASLSTTSISFGTQLFNTTSAAQPVVLSNPGTSALTITSIVTSPAANFGQTNDCGGSLAARGSCVIQVTFTPTSSGTTSISFSGTLTFSDNAPGSSQQVVQLSGTGADFTMVASPGAASAVAGLPANYALTVTPAPSFNGMVSFTCSGLPVGAACGFTPPAVALGGVPALVQVTVTTTGSGHAAVPAVPPSWTLRLPMLSLLWLLTLLLIPLVRRRAWRRLRVAAPAALLALVLVFSMACGGGMASNPNGLAMGATPPGNYVITITGTAPGGAVQTFRVSLTVTP